METNLQVESGGGDGKGKAQISINNGRELKYVNYGRGLNVAVLDENTGEMISFACFDTFAKECGDYFAEFIENLPNGRIVAIAVKDTAVGVETNSLSDKALATCKSLGSKEIDKLGMRDSWALIAKKGEPNAAKEALAKATHKNDGLFPETPVTAKTDLNVSGKPSNGLVISVTSGGYNNVDSSASITIDGRDALKSDYKDGINVVVFGGDNSKPLSTHVFNPYIPGQADEFAKLIEELPENRIVAITVKGDGKGALNDRGKTACKALGSRLVDKLESNGSWTLIAQKGKPGSAIENLKNTPVAKDLSGKPVPVAVSLRLPAPIPTAAPTTPATPASNGQNVRLQQKVQLNDLKVDCYSNWWSTSKSVALKGKRSLVGAPLSEVGKVVNAGAVYVMEYQDGQWSSKQKLLHPEPVINDLFGLSVDFDGNWAIVGAPKTANNYEVGAAYIFQLENGEWKYKQKLQGPKDYSGYQQGYGYHYDSFGYSVAISGELAIVGAPYTEAINPYRANAGAAHIFKLENGTWQFKQTLVPDDLRGGDLFGGSVDIDGDVAIAGGFYVYNSSNVSTGGAYIFQSQNGQWQQVQKLQPDDLKYLDWFGTPLALKGDLAIVGAYGTDRPSVAGDVGAAYIFQKLQNGKWELMQKLQPDDLKAVDCFGTSVAISGKVAVVGAMWVDVPAVNAGAAYIFQLENGKWQLKQKVQPEKLAYYEWFGHSVAVDGEIALVRGNKQYEAGAGDEAGAVYFFETTA